MADGDQMCVCVYIYSIYHTSYIFNYIAHSDIHTVHIYINIRIIIDLIKFIYI